MLDAAQAAMELDNLPQKLPGLCQVAAAGLLRLWWVKSDEAQAEAEC